MQFNTRNFRRSAYATGAAVVVAGVVALTGAIHVKAFGSNASGALVATEAPMNETTVSPLVALNHATEAVVDNIMPAVVSVSVSGTQKVRMQQMPNMDQIPDPFRQFFFQGPNGNGMQQAPQAQPFAALGSGVIISPDGYIVTNDHVVDGAKQVKVTLSNQKDYPAKVVGTDKATDLAVIKIDATGLTSAAFGDSSALKPGDTVIAVGDPMQMDFSVSRGIVSAVNRARLGDGPNSRGAFIQTDAAINHGNSGGPLVNAWGQVIGINTEILSESGASDGIGFAIPSNLVKPTAEELIKNGKVERGSLGVTVADLLPDVASGLNEPDTKGALVNAVTADSPAAKAGIKQYDVITAFNGEKITGSTELQTMAGGTSPGAVAHLEVMRDGKPMNFSVTMANYDQTYAEGTPTATADNSASGTPKLGISVANLTSDIRGQLQLPDDVTGAVVQSVDANGPAMLAGIGQGDVIEQINRHPVTSVEDLQHQLSLAPQGKSVLLLDHKSNGDFILSVRPEADSGN